MIRDKVLDHLVDQVFRRWEARRYAASAASLESPRHPFTITLEREAGARGTSVAQEVGRRLGWPVYDHALLERIAEDSGLRASLLESVDERRVGWVKESFQEFVQAFAEVSFATTSSYVHHLVRTLLALGANGECVIVGRGACFVLPRETTLSVRLMAPLPERIAMLARELGVSAHEAEREVRRIDRERTDFIRNTFSKDPFHPLHYDQVLNSARLSVAGCAEVILVGLRQLQAEEAEKLTVAPLA